jgi:hypothetical protein
VKKGVSPEKKLRRNCLDCTLISRVSTRKLANSRTDNPSSQHSTSKRSEERDGTRHAADQALNVLIDRRGRVEVYIPACEQSQQTTR